MPEKSALRKVTSLSLDIVCRKRANTYSNQVSKIGKMSRLGVRAILVLSLTCGYIALFSGSQFPV